MSPSAPFDIASGDAGIAGLAEYSDPGNSNDRRQHAARKCARGEALQELSSTTDQEQNAAIDRRIGLGRRSPIAAISSALKAATWFCFQFSVDRRSWCRSLRVPSARRPYVLFLYGMCLFLKEFQGVHLNEILSLQVLNGKPFNLLATDL